MDYDQSELISPFGPKILISKCPEIIINCLNEYFEKIIKNKKFRDEYSSFGNGKIPNLLKRNLENIYLDSEFSKVSGIANYLENIGNLYLQKTNQNSSYETKLQTVNFDKKEISDCWINRYFGCDFTPLHVHGARISGVIFLKIPNFLLQHNLNNEKYMNEQGKISFIYGSENEFCEDTWFPDQDLGTVLVFPSWLRHIVYPTNSDEERRTFSFNLGLKYLKKNDNKIINYC